MWQARISQTRISSAVKEYTEITEKFEDDVNVNEFNAYNDP